MRDQLRPGEHGGAGASVRDRLLDVRRHLEITAEQLTPRRGAGEHRHLLGRQERRGSPRSWWPSSSGPPRGFPLADESRTRPRFAPVFLKEGFAKSDTQSTTRAVAALESPGVSS